MACYVHKHSPGSWKENTLSLLTGLGVGYCCILLPQIRHEGNVLSSQTAFCAPTTRIAKLLCLWRDVIAGSTGPISPNPNSCRQNQHELASIGKQMVMVGKPEVLPQSLPSFGYRLSVVYQRSLNVSEQNCIVY